MHRPMFRMRTPLSALALVAGFSLGGRGPGALAAGKENPFMTPNRALIVLTNHAQLGDTGRKTGFYLSEAAHPFEVFSKAGLQVEFASPAGGHAPMDGTDTEDPVALAHLKDSTFVALTEETKALDGLDPAHYDIVFFAGGHGTMWDFPNDPAVQHFTASVYEAGGIVAAVCHGPAALVNVRLSDGRALVEGRALTAFSNTEEKKVELDSVVPFALESVLVERGARFSAAPAFQAHVVVDERLATGQNPASARGVAEAAVDLARR